jgi:hypothetical protein
MTKIGSRGGEELRVGLCGPDVALAVVDDRFGRIASVRVDADAAAELAWALLELSAAASPAGADRTGRGR